MSDVKVIRHGGMGGACTTVSTDTGSMHFDDEAARDLRDQERRLTQKKRELADAALQLTNDKAFQQAISELRMRWYEQLMTDLNREQKDELLAMSRALKSIPEELGVIMNNYKMALDRQRKHG